MDYVDADLREVAPSEFNACIATKDERAQLDASPTWSMSLAALNREWKVSNLERERHTHPHPPPDSAATISIFGPSDDGREASIVCVAE